jgi:hypothetical protein
MTFITTASRQLRVPFLAVCTRNSFRVRFPAAPAIHLRAWCRLRMSAELVAIRATLWHFCCNPSCWLSPSWSLNGGFRTVSPNCSLRFTRFTLSGARRGSGLQALPLSPNVSRLRIDSSSSVSSHDDSGVERRDGPWFQQKSRSAGRPGCRVARVAIGKSKAPPGWPTRRVLFLSSTYVRVVCILYDEFMWVRSASVLIRRARRCCA